MHHLVTWAVVAFGIAAGLGLALARRHIRHQQLSVPFTLIHGLFAATGLVFLLIPFLQGSTAGAVNFALGLFVLAALGGLGLLALHLRGRRLRPGLIAGHGLVAVIAFLMLLVRVLRG